jgi:tripartite-type tricarboxylate transporter receptor subunit TctC
MVRRRLAADHAGHLASPETDMRHPTFRSASRRSLLAAALAAAAALAVPTPAAAQAFPSKPITLIVPWPAGGSTDRHLRGLAEIASRHLGQPVVVSNQPGAGGTLGPGTMALNARPDGYTIAQFPMGMLRIPHMSKQQWHPINDFSFIVGVSGYTFGFVVKSDSPHKSFNDYVEAARKEPGAVNSAPPATAPARTC